jgi:valyl-tRNA synthetase
VWSWWHADSVHTQPWPTTGELSAAAQGGDPRMIGVLGQALAGLRRAKSEAKVSMRTPVDAATIAGPEADVARVRLAQTDLVAAGKVGGELSFGTAASLVVRDVELATV